MALAEPIKNSGGNTKKHKKRISRIKEKTIKQIKKENMQLEVLSKEIPVTPDFIEENKKLCQTIPKYKKGGPYSKQYKKTIRDEVFKLHFEYGYSARKISQMNNINRNTINGYVSFWYSKMRVDYDKILHQDWLNKQFFRLESQRALLCKELDSNITLQERLQVRKMILDLDSKIGNFVVKIQTSKQLINDESVQIINAWLAQHHHTERYMSAGYLYFLPIKAREKIVAILNNL